jgi:hypothetical protein
MATMWPARVVTKRRSRVPDGVETPERYTGAPSATDGRVIRKRWDRLATFEGERIVSCVLFPPCWGLPFICSQS